VNCFDHSKHLNLLVTGAADHIVRLWNPYVYSKPIAVLEGHYSAVIDVMIYDALEQVFSYSSDAVCMIRSDHFTWIASLSQWLILGWPMVCPYCWYSMGERPLFIVLIPVHGEESPTHKLGTKPELPCPMRNVSPTKPLLLPETHPEHLCALSLRVNPQYSSERAPPSQKVWFYCSDVVPALIFYFETVPGRQKQEGLWVNESTPGFKTACAIFVSIKSTAREFHDKSIFRFGITVCLYTYRVLSFCRH